MILPQGRFTLVQLQVTAEKFPTKFVVIEVLPKNTVLGRHCYIATIYG